MYKSRQKAIGVAAISLGVLGAFAVGTWAIIDASYKVPRGDALVAKYSGLTKYLDRGGTLDGSLNINTLSINDWINLNMPTKVLFEKTNDGFDGYYYTFDEDIQQQKPKTKEQLDALVNSVKDKAFIAKVSFKIIGNTYSYSVFGRDFLRNEYFKLGNTTLTFSDSNFTEIKSMSTWTPTSNFSQNFVNQKLTIGSYSLSYSKTSDSQLSYLFNINSNVNNSLVFGTNIKPSNNKGFSIANSSINSSSTITSTYSEQVMTSVKEGDTITPKNYIIYNVNYSSSAGGGTLTRASYMSNWRVSGENQFAKFHLPNEIGLFPIWTPFGIATPPSNP